ncbi:hypothetical protein GCM10020254_06390 [Streptomyces goshikiensis]
MTLAEPLPTGLRAEIVSAYEQLGRDEGREDPEVAVRSSATAEDLPEASFAGQQETYLNVRGTARLLEAVHRCYASLYTDRAIDYRERMGFDHLQVALSVGVQIMVRSDLAGAGVIFTLDPESGFPEVIVISAACGLGETVVSGQVDPDEYTVFKPSLKDPGLNPLIDVRVGAKRRKAVYAEHGLTRTVDTTAEERSQRVLTDAEVRLLADWALTVEGHYGCPMDLEWAKDGLTGDLWIVQARPETVQSRRAASTLRRCRLTAMPGTPLLAGIAVGEAIGSGPVVVMDSPVDLDRFPSGGVLVTGITDPDWEPIMKRASAIVTDHGGRTSHAAIVSRELGVPAVVGTGRATRTLHDGQQVTVSLCRRRTRRGLRRADRLRGDRDRPRGHPRHADARHAQPRRPLRSLPVVAPAGRWGRSGPAGVHRGAPGQGPPHGPAAPRPSGRRRSLRRRPAHRGIPRPHPLLQRSLGVRHRPDRRLPLARPGRRTNQRLQDQ